MSKEWLQLEEITDAIARLRDEYVDARVVSRYYGHDIMGEMVGCPISVLSYTGDYIELLQKQVQELEDELNKQLEISYKFEGKVHDLTKQSSRYRETIEYIKLELRDFRKDANTIKKLSRDRIVQSDAIRLSCDIRDCLEALESNE